MYVESEKKIVLRMDNQSAIRLIKNLEFHKRSKHIDVRYHFIREKHNEGYFGVEYVDTRNQLADIYTKSLMRVKFVFMREMNGVTKFEGELGFCS